MRAIGEHRSSDCKPLILDALLLLSFTLQDCSAVEGALPNVCQLGRNMFPSLTRIIEFTDALKVLLRSWEVAQVRPT